MEGIILDYHDLYFEEQKENQQITQKRLTELHDKLKAVKEQMALGKIDAELYNEFSTQYKTEIAEIEEKLSLTQAGTSNLKKCLDYVLKFCLNPLLLWESRDTERKMQLQRFIFPNGISAIKQTRGLLTNSINPLFAPIAQIARALRENEKGQPVELHQLSFRVTSEGVKPSTF